MPSPSILTVNGEVDSPQQLTLDDLRSIDHQYQVSGIDQLGFKWPGSAVRLSGLLELVGVRPTAKYLGLHSSHDDFHASIPLAPVLEKAIIIYLRDGHPLDIAAGGPLRLFIPDHAACHMDEIDECANLKFLDHLELTVGKGYDNRPQDDAAHQRLHENQRDHAP
jgi:DMSO/TMAO reductase YedYZ molybdopterin-dependent catalytic subunit